MIPRREFLTASARAALATMGGGAILAIGRWPVQVDTTPADGDAAVERMQWWREARFGMFVHFGVYSLLAGEWKGRTNYGEWIRNNAQIPIDQYDTLLDRFNPTAFDADRLAALAAAAGMRYLVFTTKHHDGFALWPSARGNFNVTRTPYNRDIMRLVADACRRHGVFPCWYHSIMDWHHPDYLPRREWEVGERPVGSAKFEHFVADLHGQIEELLTQYGDIGVLWFDGEWETTWNRELGAALAARCRALQPKILLNSRVAPKKEGEAEQSGSMGDFGTPELKVPDRGLPGVDWESCMTMNQNWGFNRADHDWKSVPKLVELLVETTSKGGNLLLNVGPEGDGRIPQASVERLEGLAVWMKRHGEAIHATSASPFEGAPFRATRRERRINCFLHAWPTERELLIPGLRSVPSRLRMLGDGRRGSLPARAVDGGVVVTLPERPSDPICSVLALDFAVPPRIDA